MGWHASCVVPLCVEDSRKIGSGLSINLVAFPVADIEQVQIEEKLDTLP